MSRTILLVNQSKYVTPAALAQTVASLQLQVDQHFRRWWATGCVLQVGTSAGAGQEVIYLVDSLSVQNALGYHDVAGVDTPVGFVDVELTQQVGDHWTATLSHELLEQLVDPFCQGAYLVEWQGQPAAVAAETADPVENWEYQIGGVWLSDFITPYWFVAGSPHATHWLASDASKRLAPLTAAPKGYVAYTNDLVNWQQTFGKEAPHHQRSPHPLSRRERRFSRWQTPPDLRPFPRAHKPAA